MAIDAAIIRFFGVALQERVQQEICTSRIIPLYERYYEQMLGK